MGFGLVLLAFALTGCRSVDPALVDALAGDNAHIKARVTSLYGTIEFERRMEFAPPTPPAPTPPRAKRKAKPVALPAADFPFGDYQPELPTLPDPSTPSPR